MRIGFRFAQIAFVLAFAAYMDICLFSVTQASTPDTPLYGLKTAIEDTRLRWTTDPAQHASLALDFANERVSEIMQLSDRGQVVQQTVVLRLQDQLRQATRDASRADEHHVSHSNALSQQSGSRGQCNAHPYAAIDSSGSHCYRNATTRCATHPCTVSSSGTRTGARRFTQTNDPQPAKGIGKLRVVITRVQAPAN
jgi:hypothetical protein